VRPESRLSVAAFSYIDGEQEAFKLLHGNPRQASTHDDEHGQDHEVEQTQPLAATTATATAAVEIEASTTTTTTATITVATTTRPPIADFGLPQAEEDILDVPDGNEAELFDNPLAADIHTANPETQNHVSNSLTKTERSACGEDALAARHD
jgi:hypothetical protein